MDGNRRGQNAQSSPQTPPLETEGVSLLDFARNILIKPQATQHVAETGVFSRQRCFILWLTFSYHWDGHIKNHDKINICSAWRAVNRYIAWHYLHYVSHSMSRAGARKISTSDHSQAIKDTGHPSGDLVSQLKAPFAVGVALIWKYQVQDSSTWICWNPDGAVDEGQDTLAPSSSRNPKWTRWVTVPPRCLFPSMACVMSGSCIQGLMWWNTYCCPLSAS